jgi:outer membrane protein assembly factor BamB
MEGYNLKRDRATTDEIQPPLKIIRELSIGDVDTQYTGPVGVARDLLFVEGVRTLHVLAATTGQEKWHFNLAGSYISPAVAGDGVFVRAESGQDGYILALSLDSGARRWQFKFPHVGSSYSNFGGHVTSPLIVDGLVLVGASQTFFALDAETGEIVWTFRTGKPVSSSAAVADGTLYFTDFARLYAVDIATGEERWHFEHESLSLFFAPIIAEDRVVFSSFGALYVLERNTGNLLWSREFDSDRIIPAAAAGDHIYVKTIEHLYALDALTGETRWRYGSGDYISMPAVTSQQIYVVTRVGGSAQLRAINRADGQESWVLENPKLTNAAPVIAGGRVYVRTVDGRILVYVNSAG